MRAAAVALAILPLVSAVGLVLHAGNDDPYYVEPRSYWESHAGGPQVLVVVAVIVNLLAVTVLIASAAARHPRLLWIGVVLIPASVVVSVIAFVAITVD